MTALEGRITRLELMLNRLQMQLVSLSGQVARVQAAAQNQGAVVTIPGGPPPDPGSGAAGSNWVMAPTGGSPASTGTFPTITPSVVSCTVYGSAGGTLNVIGIRTVRWWYRDALPQYTLVPVVPCGDGSFDAIANSCTIVNP